MNHAMSNIFTSQEEFSEQVFESLDQKGIGIEDIEFEACTFKNCNFGGAIFKLCKFVDCKFEHCDLSNLQINRTVFRNTSFNHCKLLGINWANASSVAHLNFEKSILDYSSFVGLDLRKSVIRECIAREADFADTNLGEADCKGTDFTSARFANTNLVKADFRQAINYNIRYGENKLMKTRFSLPEATLLLYGLDILLEE